MSAKSFENFKRVVYQQWREENKLTPADLENQRLKGILKDLQAVIDPKKS